MDYQIISDILQEKYIVVNPKNNVSWDSVIEEKKVKNKDGSTTHFIMGKSKLIMKWLRNKINSLPHTTKIGIYRTLLTNIKQYQNIDKVIKIRYTINKNISKS